MRLLIATVCVGTAFALAAPPAQGNGIPASLKGKKVQGDLVPAYGPAPLPAGSGHGDDESDSPAILATPELRGNCIFEKGKFKTQVGKDASVKLKGVSCGGVAYTGQLCAHTKTVATIMDEEIDKNGDSSAKVCLPPAGPDTANTMSFVTGSIGLITCVAGDCEGTLPPVTDDPCPDVDKVVELRRFEVFDGPYMGTFTISGATIGACCGPTQTVAGPISVGVLGDCPGPGSGQDVMGEMGYVVQGAD